MSLVTPASAADEYAEALRAYKQQHDAGYPGYSVSRRRLSQGPGKLLFAYRYGCGVEIDLVQASRLEEMACELGDATSCASLPVLAHLEGLQ